MTAHNWDHQGREGLVGTRIGETGASWYTYRGDRETGVLIHNISEYIHLRSFQILVAVHPLQSLNRTPFTLSRHLLVIEDWSNRPQTAFVNAYRLAPKV